MQQTLTPVIFVNFLQIALLPSCHGKCKYQLPNACQVMTNHMGVILSHLTEQTNPISRKTSTEEAHNLLYVSWKSSL